MFDEEIEMRLLAEEARVVSGEGVNECYK